ncbi:sigma-54 dependent transcriptional regulator [Armatimonas sp.]|uniref:sigma-54-dependent transcriptional regulator n=1 Tax=Armatimonas sp. TaxID=1872638 RepID=UPI00286B70C1|nr:sigma-54 dependent transcriptional regulator [Armatimonas sp.]
MTAQNEEIKPSGMTILIVDDEPNLRRVLSAVLARDGHQVLVADGGRDAVRKAKAERKLDLLITDYLMPDMNGLEVLEAVRKNHPGLRALIISGHGTVRSAVEAMRLGAFDFITKPFDVEQVRHAVERALIAGPEPTLQSIAQGSVPAGKVKSVIGSAPNLSTAVPAPNLINIPGVSLIGNAPATQKMVHQLLQASHASRATVLLLGESGTGKEVAARLVHEASPRKRGPFMAISCAALPDTLLESELFGHEKSAFTGAAAAKPGKFELADGGTLFLDEIGDIPHLTQVKLLRALQEREICRIGGVKNVKVDVRVVAATNRDLWQAVQEGTFRLDLYFRLYVVPVHLPALRERVEDIPSLALYFLNKIAKDNDRAFPEGISEATLEYLVSHSWPGNIRELQNVIEYAVVMSSEGATRIEVGVLPETLQRMVEVQAQPQLKVVNG